MLFIFGGDLNRIEVGNWERVRASKRTKEGHGKWLSEFWGKWICWLTTKPLTYYPVPLAELLCVRWFVIALDRFWGNMAAKHLQIESIGVRCKKQVGLEMLYSPACTHARFLILTLGDRWPLISLVITFLIGRIACLRLAEHTALLVNTLMCL